MKENEEAMEYMSGSFRNSTYTPSGNNGALIVRSPEQTMCIIGLNQQINTPPTADIKLLVTAQFPDSDVQLRKTGLQSKDKEKNK